MNIETVYEMKEVLHELLYGLLFSHMVIVQSLVLRFNDFLAVLLAIECDIDKVVSVVQRRDVHLCGECCAGRVYNRGTVCIGNDDGKSACLLCTADRQCKRSGSGVGGDINLNNLCIHSFAIRRKSITVHRIPLNPVARRIILVRNLSMGRSTSEQE